LDPALSAKTEKLSQWKSNNNGGKFLTLIKDVAKKSHEVFRRTHARRQKQIPLDITEPVGRNGRLTFAPILG
jgi:hypothetical protein